MIALIAASQAEQTEQRLTILIYLLLGVAVMLTLLTIWFWRHTSPARRKRMHSRASDLGYAEMSGAGVPAGDPYGQVPYQGQVMAPGHVMPQAHIAPPAPGAPLDPTGYSSSEQGLFGGASIPSQPPMAQYATPQPQQPHHPHAMPPHPPVASPGVMPGQPPAPPQPLVPPQPPAPPRPRDMQGAAESLDWEPRRNRILDDAPLPGTVDNGLSGYEMSSGRAESDTDQGSAQIPSPTRRSSDVVESLPHANPLMNRGPDSQSQPSLQRWLHQLTDDPAATSQESDDAASSPSTGQLKSFPPPGATRM